MSAEQRTIRATLHHANRVPSSRLGNPRFELVFDAPPFRASTEADSAAGWDAKNLRPQDHVLLTLDSRNRIIAIRPEPR